MVKDVRFVVSSSIGLPQHSVVCQCWQQVRIMWILLKRLVQRLIRRCGISSSMISRLQLMSWIGSLWMDSMDVLLRVWLLLILVMPICGKLTVWQKAQTDRHRTRLRLRNVMRKQRSALPTSYRMVHISWMNHLPPCGTLLQLGDRRLFG